MEGWTPPEILAVVAIIGITGIAIVGLTRGLIRAGQSHTASMLVVSMSLLTLAALLGGLFFDSDSALAVAGAGMGALAGAVNSIFTSTQLRETPPSSEESQPE